MLNFRLEYKMLMYVLLLRGRKNEIKNEHLYFAALIKCHKLKKEFKWSVETDTNDLQRTLVRHLSAFVFIVTTERLVKFAASNDVCHASHNAITPMCQPNFKVILFRQPDRNTSFC